MSRTWRLGSGLLMAGLVISPALAVCEFDGTGHPSVSIIFGQLTDPGTCNEQIISTCEATLISPTVAITTASCANEWATGGGFELTATWLSNTPDDFLDCASADRIASFHTHPSFDPADTESPFNIGVIVLAASSTHSYASLPAAGAVDLLSSGEPVEAVAYVSQAAGTSSGVRTVGSAILTKTTSTFFKIRKVDHGCTPGFDGSGVFLAGGQDLIGMNIGSQKGSQLRLDIPEVRDFLDDYVTLP